MKKPIFLVLLTFFLALAVGSTALAHSDELAQVSEITAFDLDVSEPTLLPTSPFYFFKEWSRGVERLFTFNAVRKVELELRITDEKAIETREVVERSPENTEALEQALDNYQDAASRLNARLNGLGETSENPNVSRLLDKLAERALQHEYLFEELGGKTENADIKAKFDEHKGEVSDGLLKTADRLEDADKLTRRIKKAVDAEEVKDELENVRKVEFFDSLEEKAVPNVAQELRRVREDFVEDARIILEKYVKSFSADVTAEKLKVIPGDAILRAKMIAEIKVRTSKEHKGEFEDLEEEFKETDRTNEALKDNIMKAAEQISDAEKKSSELEKKIVSAADRVSAAARTHLIESRSKLNRAKRAFEAKDYGEAFGQAISAEALARNGLRLVEEKDVDTEDVSEDLTELGAKIDRYAAEMTALGWTEENNAKAYELLGEARRHLGFAKEALAKNDLPETKSHIGHVKDWLRELSSLFIKEAAVVRPTSIPCPDIRVAACEENSASENCVRELKSLDQKYPGCGYEKQINAAACGPMPLMPTPTGCKGPVCQSGKWQFLCPEPETEKSSGTTAEPQRALCTQEYNPVCGYDGKTYSNECTANGAGVVITSKGECSKTPDDCGTAPLLAAPPPGCKYDGPSCKEGKWQYALVCPEPTSEPTEATPTTVLPAPTTDTAKTEPTTSTVSPIDSTDTAVTASQVFKIEADDYGFYPSGIITVTKGTRVSITFTVRSSNVYYGGLDFVGARFKTGTVKPGSSATTEFTADESFEFYSYWPLTNTLKATGKIVLQ